MTLKPKQGRRHGKHIHSTGLSLEKFAEVKSSRFDKKRLIEKQRLVHIKRAKAYNKVKAKLIEEGKYHEAPTIPTLETSDGEQEARSDRPASSSPHREQSGHAASTSQQDEEAPLPRGKKVKQPKKATSMQILAAKLEKEREAAREKQEEAKRATEKRRKAAAVAERRRKATTVKHFKKTKKGQPIMKYRLEKILQTLGKS